MFTKLLSVISPGGDAAVGDHVSDCTTASESEEVAYDGHRKVKGKFHMLCWSVVFIVYISFQNYV